MGTLMTKIRTNLEGFVESGAWDFLLLNDEFHNPGNDDDELEDNVPDEDKYEPESEDYSSDDYSDESEEDDEDFDDEYSDDDGGGYEDASEEEEGLDWDEMDRRAAAHDRKANQRDGAQSSTNGKRSRGSNQSYGNSPQQKRRRY